MSDGFLAPELACSRPVDRSWQTEVDKFHSPADQAINSHYADNRASAEGAP